MLPKYERILYATGLSDKAPQVFRHAVSLAMAHGGKITLVHGVEPVSNSAQAMVEACLSEEQRASLKNFGQDRIREDIRNRLELFCERETCKIDNGGDIVDEIRVLEGRAEEVILSEAARTGADLIVMGTHRHSTLGEIFLGSAAHAVMLRAKTPVLLVRID